MKKNLPLIPMIPESGEPSTVPECERCGIPNAKGISYVSNERMIFKCDSCGRSMLLNFLESAHKKQVESKLGKERAADNRDRFWRENQEKQRLEYERRKEEGDPNAHEVFNIDYVRAKI